MKLYPVVILAGGIATRLRPMTEKIPKALVEVGGKPFIASSIKSAKISWRSLCNHFRMV